MITKKLCVLVVFFALLLALPVGAALADADVVLEDAGGDVTLYTLGAETRYKVTDVASGAQISDQAYTGSLVLWQNASNTARWQNPIDRCVTIESGAHSMQLKNVSIASSRRPPISVKSGAKLTLMVVGDHRADLKSTKTANPYGEKGISGLEVEAGAILTIEGAPERSTLYVTGGKSGAGIGNAGNSGNIIINGGTINAHGGSDGAGIGGGFDDIEVEGGVGHVVINGGDVVGTAGSFGTAAGIGGGNKGAGNVTINGGVVYGYGFTGIGSGYLGQYSFVTVNGGIVTAESFELSAGAGIGGGMHTTVNINGGTLTVTGAIEYGKKYAAFLSGMDAFRLCFVNISNMDIYEGTVYKKSKKLESYQGEHQVYIVEHTEQTGNGNKFFSQGVPDMLGNMSWAGIGTGDGTEAMAEPIGGPVVQEIISMVGGVGVAGFNGDVTGGSPSGVGFGVSKRSLKLLAAGKRIIGYFIAHPTGGGDIEKIPVSVKSLGQNTIFKSKQAPTGASPFVLVMQVGDPLPQTPPKTGEASRPWLWLGLGLASLCGLALLTKRRRPAKR